VERECGSTVVGREGERPCSYSFSTGFGYPFIEDLFISVDQAPPYFPGLGSNVIDCPIFMTYHGINTHPTFRSSQNRRTKSTSYLHIGHLGE
jgi:hypothetical protein